MPLTEPDLWISHIRLFTNTLFDSHIDGYLRYKTSHGFHSVFQFSDWTMPLFAFTY